MANRFQRFTLMDLTPEYDADPNAVWREMAFRALPAPHRLALALVVAQGSSYTEVGQVLDCSVEVVQRLVYEAREAMRIAALAPLTVPNAPTAGGYPALSPMEEA